MAETSCVALAAPGHRDHEADGKNPRDRPDGGAGHEAHRGLHPPWSTRVTLLRGGGEEPAEDQHRVDAAHPDTQRPALGRLLRKRNAVDLRQGGPRRVERRMDAAQDEDLRRGLDIARVEAIEGGDAPFHHALLPEVREISRDQRDQKRRAGDRPVDAGDLRRLDSQFLGDHRARHVRSLLQDAGGPLERGLAQAIRAEQRETGRDVLRVAVGDRRQPPPPGQPVLDAPRASAARGRPANRRSDQRRTSLESIRQACQPRGPAMTTGRAPLPSWGVPCSEQDRGAHEPNLGIGAGRASRARQPTGSGAPPPGDATRARRADRRRLRPRPGPDRVDVRRDDDAAPRGLGRPCRRRRRRRADRDRRVQELRRAPRAGPAGERGRGRGRASGFHRRARRFEPPARGRVRRRRDPAGGSPRSRSCGA